MCTISEFVFPPERNWPDGQRSIIDVAGMILFIRTVSTPVGVRTLRAVTTTQISRFLIMLFAVLHENFVECIVLLWFVSFRVGFFSFYLDGRYEDIQLPKETLNIPGPKPKRLYAYESHNHFFYRTGLFHPGSRITEVATVEHPPTPTSRSSQNQKLLMVRPSS